MNFVSVAFRIIPTRVGTRQFEKHNRLQQGDHPHACGDKVLKVSVVVIFLGSSPRVWGQVQRPTKRRDNSRIIPTRVGTSLQSGFFVFYFRDHPHACGDKKLAPDRASRPLGSSPRVWGQVAISASSKSFCRIIPTRVGTRALKSRTA